MADYYEIDEIVKELASSKKFSGLNRNKLAALLRAGEKSVEPFTVNDMRLADLKAEVVRKSSEKTEKRFSGPIRLSITGGALAAAAILAFVIFSVTEPEPQKGKISFFSGNVTIERGNLTYRAAAGLEIMQGDLIVTGPGSSADMEYSDIRVRVPEKSEVKFSTMKAGEARSEFVSFLKSGSIVMIVNKLRQNDAVSVRTATSVAAVRGTVFGAKLNKDNSVRYEVFEGKVLVRNRVPEEFVDADVAQELDEYFEKNAVIIGQNESCMVEPNIESLKSINKDNFDESLDRLELPASVSADVEPLQMSTTALNFIEKSKSVSSDIKLLPVKIAVAPERAEIRVNGSSVGIGHTSILLNRGSYRIDAAADGYKPKTVVVKIDEVNNFVAIALEKIDDSMIQKKLAAFTSSYVLHDNESGVLLSIGREGSIHAMDLKKILWSASMRSIIISEPVILNGALFVPASDETITAMDLKTGKILWKRYYTGRVSDNIRMYANGGSIYFETSRYSFYRIRPDGSVVWEVKFSEPASAFSTGSSRFSFVSFASGVMIGIDGRTGLKMLKSDFKDRMVFMKVIDNRLYMASSTGKLICFNFTDDRLVWIYDTKTPLVSSIFSDGDFYLIESSGYAHKVDTDGNLSWKVFAGLRSEAILSSDENHLFIAGGKNISILDKNSGDVTWSLVVPDIVSKNMAVTDSMVHIVLENKGLVSLKKE